MNPNELPPWPPWSPFFDECTCKDPKHVYLRLARFNECCGAHRDDPIALALAAAEWERAADRYDPHNWYSLPLLDWFLVIHDLIAAENQCRANARAFIRAYIEEMNHEQAE